MSLPSELQSALPDSIAPERVRAAVRAPGSKGSFGGETWIVELDVGLAVLGRTSIFDALEWVELADDGEPAVRVRADGFMAKVAVRCADGEVFELQPSSLDRGTIEELLVRATGLAPRPDSAAPGPIAAPPSPVVSVAALAPAELAPADPVPGAVGLDAVAESLARGEFSDALARARALVGLDNHADLVATLELTAAGDLAGAYLWTRGARQMPFELDEVMTLAFATGLREAGEPKLAWSAWEDLDDEQRSGPSRVRIEHELGCDGPSIARDVAERARRFFAEAHDARPRDPGPLRGLAEASLALDELADALRWVRQALALDRSHFDTRMQEALVLTSLAIESEDGDELTEALLGVARDFPDRAEPLVDLADFVEYDDPLLAIRCLKQALERDYDEFTVHSLADLLAAQGRHSDVLELLEDALRRPQTQAWDRGELERRRDQARARFGLSVHDGVRAELAVPEDQASSARVVVWLAIGVVIFVAIALLS